MSVLVYVDSHHGKFPKSSLEAVSYAASIANALNTDAVVLTIGSIHGDGGLGKAGAKKVLNANAVNSTDSQQLTRLVVAAAQKENAQIVVFSHDISGKMIAPRVAARLDAGLIPGATSIPTIDGGFKVKKNVFSGKAIAEMEVVTEKKVITLLPNSYSVADNGSEANVETFQTDLGTSTVRVKEVKSEEKEGEIPLPEADLVVSAGRGMKGPENWGIIEELAQHLGAATACSRPVSDIGWRPHHEHVGQTGITIRPNLYIAVGISGAIQHLAGVNGSKTIVVINKDPEAPFFKAADYGIVGDAFDVVPKLIEAAKAYNATK